MLDKSIKSKVKFSGDYEKELKNTIDFIELAIEEKIDENFKVDFIDIGKNYLKIKIKDDDKKIFRMINCIFRYDNNDKRFGNTNIEFVISELSLKPILFYVGKFNILDRENIKNKIIKDLLDNIEEIY